MANVYLKKFVDSMNNLMDMENVNVNSVAGVMNQITDAGQNHLANKTNNMIVNINASVLTDIGETIKANVYPKRSVLLMRSTINMEIANALLLAGETNMGNVFQSHTVTSLTTKNTITTVVVTALMAITETTLANVFVNPYVHNMSPSMINMNACVFLDALEIITIYVHPFPPVLEAKSLIPEDFVSVPMDLSKLIIFAGRNAKIMVT